MSSVDSTSRTDRAFLAVWNGFTRGLRAVAVTIFIIIVSITFLNIARRFVGLTSYLWVEETARLLLSWLTFLGGTLAVASRKHLVLDFLDGRGSPRFQRNIGRIVAIAATVFFAILIVEGFRYFEVTSARALASLEISAGWMASSAVGGGILFATAFFGSAFAERASTRAQHKATISDSASDVSPGAKD